MGGHRRGLLVPRVDALNAGGERLARDVDDRAARQVEGGVDAFIQEGPHHELVSADLAHSEAYWRVPRSAAYILVPSELR